MPAAPGRITPRHPLRVGVVFTGHRVPRWVVLLLAELEQRHSLAGLIVVQPAPAREHMAWRCYAAFDRCFLTRPDDALTETSVAELASSVPVVETPTAATVPHEVSEPARVLDLDLAIDLTDPHTGHAPGAVSRLGVLTVTCDGAISAAGIDRAFVERRPTVRLAAALVGERGALHELEVARCALDLGSIGRSRNELCWKASALLLRALERLAGAAPAFPQGAAPTRLTSVVNARSPGAGESVRLLAHMATRAAGRRFGNAIARHQWFLALRQHRSGPPDAGTGEFVPYFPPLDRDWADPFLFRQGDLTHLFFEEFRYQRASGEIAWVSWKGDQIPPAPLQPEVVLSCGHHLAYPLVFEHDGQVFLMPDNGGTGGVELWRAAEFPRRWVLERVLLEGMPLADVTLHRDGATLWLFATMPAPHGRVFDELHLFWAERLEGPWRPHPASPVVTDVGSARCAGRIFREGGSLIRPAQDGSRSYGRAMGFQVIQRLNRQEYGEAPHARVEPTWHPGITATHTWSSDGVFDAVDGRTRRSRW